MKPMRTARAKAARLNLESLEAREVPAQIGALDATFGAGGKATLDFGIGSEHASAVAVLSDGKIVVVGDDGNGDFAVARFRPNGLPDFTFGGGDGKATFNLGGTDIATSLAVQADGMLVIAGYTDRAGNNDFAVIRIAADGSGLDPNFNKTGIQTVAFDKGGALNDQARAVAIDPTGRIVLAGFDQFGTTDYDFAVAQLTSTGTPDQNFGRFGGHDFYFFNAGGGFEDKGSSLTIQTNGMIVVAGSVQVGANNFDFGVIRIKTDGTADLGFDGDGQTIIPFDTGEDRATSVAVAPDGQIVVAGYSQISASSNTDIAVARLNRLDGSLDTSFDTDGLKTIALDIGGDLDDRANAVEVQVDGKILLGATAQASDTDFNFAAVRLNTNGSFDTTFSADGKLAVDFGATASASAVAIQPNGRILIAGTAGTVGNFALARIVGTVEKPQTLVVSGNLDGAAATYSPNFATAQYVDSGFTTSLGGLGSNVRVASGDVNGDGFADRILVTGPGTPIRVLLVSGDDNVTILAGPFDPYSGDFTGGGFVAAGDFDNDGRAEIVVTPDQGGGPRVAIFSLGTDNTIITRGNFFGINDPNFRGGARAGVGDVNGDGVPDLAVAAGFQGGPRVALYNGRSVLGARPSAMVSDFFAFEQTLRNGVYVSIGDVNGDGFGDLVFGAGPGGSPRVFTISGQRLLTVGVVSALNSPLSNFLVSGFEADRGGIRVSTSDVDGDNRAEVAVGTGEGSASRVRVYLGSTFSGAEPRTYQELNPYLSLDLLDGTFVG